MPEIHVARRFTLNQTVGKDGGQELVTREFLPGKYDVSDEVADHWFVKPHLVVDDPAHDEQIATEAALLANARGVSAPVNGEVDRLRAELAAANERADTAEADRKQADEERAVAAENDAKRTNDAIAALAEVTARAERAEALAEEKQRALDEALANHGEAVTRAETAEKALGDATAPPPEEQKGKSK